MIWHTSIKIRRWSVTANLQINLSPYLIGEVLQSAVELLVVFHKTSNLMANLNNFIQEEAVVPLVKNRVANLIRVTACHWLPKVCCQVLIVALI